MCWTTTGWLTTWRLCKPLWCPQVCQISNTITCGKCKCLPCIVISMHIWLHGRFVKITSLAYLATCRSEHMPHMAALGNPTMRRAYSFWWCSIADKEWRMLQNLQILSCGMLAKAWKQTHVSAFAKVRSTADMATTYDRLNSHECKPMAWVKKTLKHKQHEIHNSPNLAGMAQAMCLPSLASIEKKAQVLPIRRHGWTHSSYSKAGMNEKHMLSLWLNWHECSQGILKKHTGPAFEHVWHSGRSGMIIAIVQSMIVLSKKMMTTLATLQA